MSKLVVGMYRILILPDIRQPDIWLIGLTGYPAWPDTGNPANFLLLIKEIFEEKKFIQTKLEVSCF